MLLLKVERVVRRDPILDVLLAASNEIVALASSTIAHTSQKAIDKDVTLTFNDLDATIDFLERLTIDYFALLKGGGFATLLPTEQFDWYEQFRFAWAPSESTA
jgi:hypothetical protein